MDGKNEETEELLLPVGALGTARRAPETPCPAPGCCHHGPKPAGYCCVLAFAVELAPGVTDSVCMEAVNQLESLRMVGAARRARNKIIKAVPGTFPGVPGNKRH